MWLARIYPELRLLPSNAERRDVVSQARRRLGDDWPRVNVLATVVGLVIYALLHLVNYPARFLLVGEVIPIVLASIAALLYVHD